MNYFEEFSAASDGIEINDEAHCMIRPVQQRTTNQLIWLDYRA
jgi:hypothetical protein